MGYIVQLIDDIGESVSLTDVSRATNMWGDASESTTVTTLSGIIQIMSGDEEEVKEGVLERGDLQAFFNSDDDNISLLVRGSRISYNSENYEIRNVIKEPNIEGGHTEILARRI